MSSFADIRAALASVARDTSDARGSLAFAETRLEEVARLYADLDGDTHEALPTALVEAARDDVRTVLGVIDRAAALVDDIDAGL